MSFKLLLIALPFLFHWSNSIDNDSEFYYHELLLKNRCNMQVRVMTVNKPAQVQTNTTKENCSLQAYIAVKTLGQFCEDGNANLIKPLSGINEILLINENRNFKSVTLEEKKLIINSPWSNQFGLLTSDELYKFILEYPNNTNKKWQ